MNDLSPYQKLIALARSDFPAYAEQYLRIATKTGELLPLTLNEGQMYAHRLIEEQRREKGYVRVITLKARQMGFSTYTEARFYHKTSLWMGQNAFILTHLADSTTSLFNMTKRYHENIADSLKPSTGASNKTELYFDNLESNFKVGTAGNDSVGRGSTIRLFHGSEVAFWNNAEVLMTGIMQAIPSGKEDIIGTEVILESTANGVGNLFHKMWMDAEAGKSDYIPIFMPWFWFEDYTRAPEPNMQYTEWEQEYADMYKLTKSQMAWARFKIVNDFQGDLKRFNQEYPATPQLAFQSSGESYIPYEDVQRARNFTVQEPQGMQLLGVDIARTGDDRTAFTYRKGRKFQKYDTWATNDLMDVVGKVKNALDYEGVEKAFLDVCGLGAGVYDRLMELGYGDKVVAVNAATRAFDTERYPNKRVEMWSNMRDWFAGDVPVDIPDEDEIHTDLANISVKKHDSHGRIVLDSKEDLKKNGLRSPDIGDSLALTFAYPEQAVQSQPMVRDNSWVT